MSNLNTIIYIGSDHAGFELKNEIRDFLLEDYKVIDVGPGKYDKNDDYPDYAHKVCEKVIENKARGILVCGTGQGMSRVANKHKGIYAEVCWDLATAIHAKEHSNANVLCFGGTLDVKLAEQMVSAWLEPKFIWGTRHNRRFQKTLEIEQMYMKS